LKERCGTVSQLQELAFKHVATTQKEITVVPAHTMKVHGIAEVQLNSVQHDTG